MTLDEEYRLSFYKKVSDLDEAHGVVLVQHLETKKYYVRKDLETFNPAIYFTLKECPVRNIPEIVDLFLDGNKLIVIEEYINGPTLEEILEHGPLPLNQALFFFRQLLLILKELHAFRPEIVHRDIKPSNIIISQEGTVKLIDLNAAKITKAGASKDTTLMGSPDYAAPEQYGFSASDHRADLYAAGVLLNVMLTGAFPNERKVTGALGDIIEKCTRLDKEERYQSAEEILQALNPPAGNTASQSVPPPPPVRNIPASAVTVSPVSVPVMPVYNTPVPPAVSPPAAVPPAAEYSAARRRRLEREQRLGRTWLRFLPPGFRSLTIWKMLIALPIYLFSYWIALTMDESEEYPAWIYKIGLTVPLTFTILFGRNYLDVWRRMGIRHIRNVRIQYLLIGLILLGFYVSFFILLTIIAASV